jgi:hypothetical protein
MDRQEVQTLLPGIGRSVLVEVKRRGRITDDDTESKLLYSHIEKHQHAALTEHRQHGGDSYIGWIADEGIALIPYANVALGTEPAFRQRTSLTWTQVKQYEIANYDTGGII